MPNYPGRTPGTRRVTVYHNGKQYEQTIKGDRTDGARFEARWRLELEVKSGTVERVAPRFSELCDGHYRIHAEQNLPSTWKNVRVYQVATLAEYFGDLRLTDISTRKVDMYKLMRREDDEMANSSINNELRVLSTILKFAREDRGFPVAEDLKIRMLPRGGEPERTPWTVAELQRLFESTRMIRPQLLPMLVFLLNTGCRKGEALAARWSWVDLEANLLRIPNTREWQPKSRKAREVPLSDGVRAILSGKRASETWIFPAEHGGRFKVFPKELFQRCRDDAQLKGGVHTLRHTFASHFLMGEPNLFLLSKVLGHSHQRVTEIYAHLLPGHLSRARNVVNIVPGLAEAAPMIQTKRNSGGHSGGAA